MRTIWLASYPKSGNTWMRMLLANLTAPGEQAVDINAVPLYGGIASARGPFDRLTLIDSDLLTFDEMDTLRPRVYEALATGCTDDEIDTPIESPVRFVKVHDAYTMTKSGEPLLAGARGAAGAILIVRDPRDIAPSLAHHNRSSIDDAIIFMNNAGACFCSNRNRQHQQMRQRLGTWSAHVTSWLEQDDIPVHLIRYEDLEAAPAATLREALAFAGHAASGPDVERAARLASFDQLATQERERGFREAPAHAHFFRRGISGAWRDELTPAQAARIEADHAVMMRRLGYLPTTVASFARAG